MPDLDISASGAHEYAVTMTDGASTTDHTVRVSERLLADLGLTAAEEPVLVRRSMEYLLQHESPGRLLRSFDLDEIATNFPDYPADIRRVLAT